LEHYLNIKLNQGEKIMVSIVEIMRRNYDSSLVMLEEIIEKCPNDLWIEIHGKFPFWQQLFHVIESIDYWIREDYQLIYDDTIKKSWSSSKNVTPYLDSKQLKFEEYLTKNEIFEYYYIVKNKSKEFFDSLEDSKINLAIAENNENFTYLDIISMQLRHIMYHVGHCICILRDNSDVDVEWKSHNEY